MTLPTPIDPVDPLIAPPQRTPVTLRRFTCQVTESHAGHRRVELSSRLIQEQLLDRLSHGLSRACIRYEVGSHSTEHRLDVYVLTPDELEHLIQQRAERLLSTEPSVYVDASQGVF